FSLSPMVGEPAAGIGVNRAEKCLQCVEQPDDENAATERLDVFGREAEPEFFAGAREHERDEQQRSVAPQREEFGDGIQSAHFEMFPLPSEGSGSGGWGWLKKQRAF